MRRRMLFGLAVAVLSAGCNLVFGLGEPALGDGPDAAADRDADVGCAVDPGGLPDEDGDGVRDACDSCPQLAGPTDDSDGDDIGDACDPRPETPDLLRGFYGFDGDTRPAALTYLLDPVSPGDSTWVVSDGDLHAKAVSPDGHMLATVPLDRAGVTVDTIYRLEGNVAEAQVVGVYASIEPTSPDPVVPIGVALVLGTTLPGSLMPRLVLTDTGGGLTQLVETPRSTFADGARVRLVLTCAGGPAPRCAGRAWDLIGGGDYVVDSIADPSPPTVRPGPIGLRVHGVDARFEYLAIYADP